MPEILHELANVETAGDRSVDPEGGVAELQLVSVRHPSLQHERDLGSRVRDVLATGVLPVRNSEAEVESARVLAAISTAHVAEATREHTTVAVEPMQVLEIRTRIVVGAGSSESPFASYPGDERRGI